MTVKTLELIEAGKREVHRLRLERFAEVYRLPVSFFTDYHDDCKPENETLRLIMLAVDQLPRGDRDEVLKFALFLHASPPCEGAQLEEWPEAGRDDNVV